MNMFSLIPTTAEMELGSCEGCTGCDGCNGCDGCEGQQASSLPPPSVGG